MIKAIVIDDEKLVRKGFIALVDWPSYGIEIVGEASSGTRALQLLNQQSSIDLMFVDITMPGMSGFEFMRQVQRQNVSAEFVILTCHHEFNYVQEALRLGAIDYIVKTLLNKDNVDETMRRISGRLQREAERKGAEGNYASDAMVVRSRNGGSHSDEIRSALPEGAICQQLSPQLHICYPGGADCSLNASELQNRLHRHWDVIEVTAGDRYSKEEAEALIVERLEHYLFYASVPAPAIVTLRELDELRHAAGDTQKQEQLQAQWQQFKWLLYGKEWNAWNDKVASARPEPAFMIGLMKELYQQWLQYMGWSPEERARLQLDTPPCTWSETAQALSELALVVQRRLADLSLSREVVICVIRALQVMMQHACDNLTQSEVAKAVNMSRSYFSQCFKAFVGHSFGEVLRNVRIDQAKLLLLESSMSVYEVSSAVGFNDNKHFSRIFKERVGMYPTEYRSGHDVIKVYGQ